MGQQGIRVRVTDTGLTLWLAFMAFLTSLSAAGVMADVLGARGSALLLAIVGGLQAATAVVNARIGPIQAAREQGHEDARAQMRRGRLQPGR